MRLVGTSGVGDGDAAALDVVAAAVVVSTDVVADELGDAPGVHANVSSIAAAMTAVLLMTRSTDASSSKWPQRMGRASGQGPRAERCIRRRHVRTMTGKR
jgi:hypothetical protein